jgi:streptogramin lyase
MATEQRSSRRLRSLWVAAAMVGVGAVVAAAALVFRPPTEVTAASDPDSLIRIDSQKPSVAQAIPFAGSPTLLATDGSDLWVASEAARTLTRVVIASGDQRPIGLDGVPTGLAVGAGTVYVAQGFAHSLERMDVKTGAQQPALDGWTLRYVAFEGADGWGIDPVADAVVHLPPGGDPRSIALPPGSGPADLAIDAESVWIANAGSHTVTRIDRQTGKAVQSTNVVDDPTAIATSDSAIWVASETGDSLARIDRSTGRVATRREAVCDAPVDLVTMGSDVWVGCAGSHELVDLDADANVIARLPLRASPSSLLIVSGNLWASLVRD